MLTGYLASAAPSQVIHSHVMQYRLLSAIMLLIMHLILLFVVYGIDLR